jgi:hypothetical protein
MLIQWHAQEPSGDLAARPRFTDETDVRHDHGFVSGNDASRNQHEYLHRLAPDHADQ